jgi:hypothetical protein
MSVFSSNVWSLWVVALLSLVFQRQSIAQDRNVAFERLDPELANYGAVDQDSLWTKNVISVCWLNAQQFSRERDLVRTAVARAWEANSGVRFTGWGDCTPAGADIKIQVDESGPRSYVGRQSLGRSPSMFLNFTFNTWSQGCRAKPDSCISSIGVHEFGHALGFQHEQLQTDAPQACVDHLKRTDQWENLPRPPTALTSYDPDSVMNYCNSVYNNNGLLSVKDKKAIAILFPKG